MEVVVNTGAKHGEEPQKYELVENDRVKEVEYKLPYEEALVKLSFENSKIVIQINDDAITEKK